MGPWSALAFVLPLVAFIALTRAQGEAPPVAAARFFRADDLAMAESDAGMRIQYAAREEEEELPLLPGDERLHQPAEAVAAPTTSPTLPPSPEALTSEDADQFAIEAETGKFGGMGLGDAKLALAIGALLGPGPAMISLFFATAAGALTGVILMRVNGRGLRQAIPFGPFMAFGAIIMMLYGRELIPWYLSLFQPHH